MRRLPLEPDFFVKEEQPDLRVAQHAFTVISQCRRLPVLLENFLGRRLSGLRFLISFKSLDDVKQNFVLIEKEIGDHMARHQVRSTFTRCTTAECLP